MSSNRFRLCLALLAAAGVFAAQPAAAQISGGSSSTAGSSQSGADDVDGFTGFSTALLINNGTTLQSRYAFNVNADVGVFSIRDQLGTAQHNVSFNATAPGGYRLDIATRRTGDMSRVDDQFGCDGSADITSVSGSSNVPLSSGLLILPDPGSLGAGTTTTSVPFNQTSSATIFAVSNGVPKAHSLTFAWSANVHSDWCEVAVRVGEQNGTTGACTACEYPGTPSRTQLGDGHFVTVTFTSLCGNGTVDAAVSEQCDEGAANGMVGSCCASTCQLKSIPQCSAPLVPAVPPWGRGLLGLLFISSAVFVHRRQGRA